MYEHIPSKKEADTVFTLRSAPSFSSFRQAASSVFFLHESTYEHIPSDVDTSA